MPVHTAILCFESRGTEELSSEEAMIYEYETIVHFGPEDSWYKLLTDFSADGEPKVSEQWTLTDDVFLNECHEEKTFAIVAALSFLTSLNHLEEVYAFIWMLASIVWDQGACIEKDTSGEYLDVSMRTGAITVHCLLISRKNDDGLLLNYEFSGGGCGTSYSRVNDLKCNENYQVVDEWSCRISHFHGDVIRLFECADNVGMSGLRDVLSYTLCTIFESARRHKEKL